MSTMKQFYLRQIFGWTAVSFSTAIACFWAFWGTIENFHWCVPTEEETIQSMARPGQNSGSEWDPENAAASYQIKPDKESPMWHIHSQVIYWWTTTEIDEEHAYIIAYDGLVWPCAKHFGPDL